jgi:hypothetical protein
VIFCSSKPTEEGGFVGTDVMEFSVRTLSPQESRVVLALAEQKRREIDRSEIIQMLGVAPKAADKVIESLRRKGWLERASWGKYLLIPPDQGPDALGESNLFALSSRIANPYYIGYGSAAAHYGLTTQHRRLVFLVTPARVRGRQVGEGRVRIVKPQPRKFFGFEPVDILGYSGGGVPTFRLAESGRLPGADRFDGADPPVRLGHGSRHCTDPRRNPRDIASACRTRLPDLDGPQPLPHRAGCNRVRQNMALTHQRIPG